MFVDETQYRSIHTINIQLIILKYKLLNTCTYRPTFPTTIINKCMIFTTQVYNCGIDCTYSFLFASNRIIWLGNHVTHEFDHVFTKLHTLVKFLPQWEKT